MGNRPRIRVEIIPASTRCSVKFKDLKAALRGACKLAGDASANCPEYYDLGEPSSQIRLVISRMQFVVCTVHNEPIQFVDTELYGPTGIFLVSIEDGHWDNKTIHTAATLAEQIAVEVKTQLGI